MISDQVEILIPFHDVDTMKVVWHGHYAKYLELARCALLERYQYNYDVMLDTDYAWPVVDMKIKYIRPLRFNQRIVVKVELVEWECRLKMNYVIEDAASGQRLCKAQTTQMAVNISTEETCFESPDILFKKLGLSK